MSRTSGLLHRWCHFADVHRTRSFNISAVPQGISDRSGDSSRNSCVVICCSFKLLPFTICARQNAVNIEMFIGCACPVDNGVSGRFSCFRDRCCSTAWRYPTSHRRRPLRIVRRRYAEKVRDGLAYLLEYDDARRDTDGQRPILHGKRCRIEDGLQERDFKESDLKRYDK